MALDLSGAFASITQSAADAATNQAASLAKGAYGTSLDVKPTPSPATAPGPLATSLPVQTTGSAQASGFLLRYWKWLALGGAVVALVVVMGRRKRR